MLIHGYSIFPDELVASSIAAYAELLGIKSNRRLGEIFFGRAGFGPKVDFPRGLEHLEQSLPFKYITWEKLQRDHTPFPYYAPFISQGSRELIIRSIRTGAVGQHIPARLGLTTTHVRLPQLLKYCGLCVSEDMTEYGRAYWRRLPQIEGVEVCPIHRVFLIQSSVPIRPMVEYVSAQRAISVTVSHPIDPEAFLDRILLQIAQDTAWLLVQQDLILDLNSVRIRYHIELKRLGLESHAGMYSSQEIIEAFEHFYSVTTQAIRISHKTEPV